MSDHRHPQFIDQSQFGSLPCRVVVLFLVITIAFVAGTSAVYAVIEDWSYLDALYFSIISISTVGYGDIVPVTTGGQVVTILFTFMSLSGIFLVFRVILGYIVDHQIAAIIDRIRVIKRKENETHRFWGFGARTTNLDQLADKAQDDLEEEADTDIHHGRNIRWIIHLIVYVLWLLMWTLFYSLSKDEDYSFFHALYFGVITSTTIGYGEYTPRSAGGKLFCLIVTMFGVLSLATLAGSASQGILALIRAFFKKKSPTKDPNHDYNVALEKLLGVARSGQGSIDRLRFVCEMMVAGKKCQRKDIEKWLGEFDKLDVNGDNVLDEKDFNVYKQKTFQGTEADYQNAAVYQASGGGGGGQMEMQITNNATHNNEVNSDTYEPEDHSMEIGLR